ncbi:hypothetical protein BGX34_008989 [Mortierella sp. NVP85]|nr:hypothetical protein BGX34_008989 [Mortierella sp. NVP85]
MDGKTPRILETAEGTRITSSIVAFAKDGEVLVGQQRDNAIYAIKHLIGRRHDDPAIQHIINKCRAVKADNGDAWMKYAAQRQLGTEIKHTVITVPAYFNDAQRQATKDAARICSLDVLNTIDGPTAVALAFGLNKAEERTVAVYHLGGSTFNISILKIQNGIIKVLSTNGDTALCGENFDAQFSRVYCEQVQE